MEDRVHQQSENIQNCKLGPTTSNNVAAANQVSEIPENLTTIYMITPTYAR